MITPRYISDLLGAPMAAIVQAEAIAAKATADPRGRVFKDVNIYWWRLRGGKKHHFHLSIGGGWRLFQNCQDSGSYLTTIPIPSLKVAEAEIEFDLAMSQPYQSAITPKSEGSIGNKFIGDTGSLRLKGIFGKKPAPNQPNTIQAANANMNVKIRLAHAEPAIGMVQLLNILDNANKET